MIEKMFNDIINIIDSIINIVTDDEIEIIRENLIIISSIMSMMMRHTRI